MQFQQLHNLISQKVLPPKGSFQNPTNSCKSIPPRSASGKYWIQSTATGYASHEYCDMANILFFDFVMLQEVATEGVLLMVGAVYTPPSLRMEYGTAKYVEG